MKRLLYALLLMAGCIPCPAFAQAPEVRLESRGYFLNKSGTTYTWTQVVSDRLDTALLTDSTTAITTDSLITRRGNFAIEGRAINSNPDSCDFKIIMYKAQSGLWFWADADSLVKTVSDTGRFYAAIDPTSTFCRFVKFKLLPILGNKNTKVTNICVGTE